MCIVCFEELTGFLAFVGAALPFLKPRLYRWVRQRRKPHLRGQVVVR